MTPSHLKPSTVAACSIVVNMAPTDKQLTETLGEEPSPIAKRIIVKDLAVDNTQPLSN